VDDIDNYDDEPISGIEDEDIPSDLESDDEVFWSSVKRPVKQSKVSESKALPTASKQLKTKPSEAVPANNSKLAKYLKDDEEDERILRNLEKKLGIKAGASVGSEFDCT